MAEMYTRRILEVIYQRLRVHPVVLLEGPRTVGKSTLLREISHHLSADIIDLDDLTVRTQVAADPGRFVVGPRPVLIDEYQRLSLLQYIKAQLNRDGSPGQFVLTGSAGREANREGLEALVGRLAGVTIHPLSQMEIEGRLGNFVEAAFGDMEEILASGRSETPRRWYVEKVLAGGFPRVLLSENVSDRYQVLNDYLNQSLDYGLATLASVRRPEDVQRLLFRYGAQTGQLLNMAGAAKDIGLSSGTAENYTRLLELLFFVGLLPSWKKTDRGPISRPKVYVVDSGVGSRILRLTSERVLSNDPLFLTQFGNLLETFVVGEVRKAISWMGESFEIGYWRSGRGSEVDLVVERLDNQAVIGMEVKSASRVSTEDWKSLRALREDLGSRFHAGMVLYTGDMPYQLDERIYAVPIDKLWHGEPEMVHQPEAAKINLLTADRDPLSKAVRDATEKMLEHLELGSAAWWEVAVVPSENISFRDFYSSAGVAGALRGVTEHSLRGSAGFGLARGREKVVPIGQCVALIGKDCRGVLIHPLGTMVAIAGGTERFLGGGGHRWNNSELAVDKNVVREWALELAWFAYQVLVPHGSALAWVYWSQGRSLLESNPRLCIDDFSHRTYHGGVVNDPPHRGIPLTGDPEVDAYYLTASFYEWFGVPAADLPEAEKGRVSASDILSF